MSCIPKNLKKNNKNINTLFCKESQAALILILYTKYFVTIAVQKHFVSLLERHL